MAVSPVLQMLVIMSYELWSVYFAKRSTPRLVGLLSTASYLIDIDGVK